MASRAPGVASEERGRTTRAWRRLCANLRARRLPCALRLTGCAGIDYSAPKGHPRSFTVDHIKSWRDYPHLREDPSNVQPACHHCNVVKGAGDGEETKPGLGEPSAAW